MLDFLKCYSEKRDKVEEKLKVLKEMKDKKTAFLTIFFEYMDKRTVKNHDYESVLTNYGYLISYWRVEMQ